MKTKIFLAALAIASVGVSTIVSAQDEKKISNKKIYYAVQYLPVYEKN